MLDTLITAVESDGEGLDVGRVTGFMNKVSLEKNEGGEEEETRRVFSRLELTSTRLSSHFAPLRFDSSNSNHLSGSLISLSISISCASPSLVCVFGLGVSSGLCFSSLLIFSLFHFLLVSVFDLNATQLSTYPPSLPPRNLVNNQIFQMVDLDPQTLSPHPIEPTVSSLFPIVVTSLFPSSPPPFRVFG